MTIFTANLVLYLTQAVAAALYAVVLEFVFKRRYEPDHTWATVVWGVAQVGLIVAARLSLAPIPEGSASDGAWYCWWLVFWSFCASALPIIFWQAVVQAGRVKQVLQYLGRRDG